MLSVAASGAAAAGATPKGEKHAPELPPGREQRVPAVPYPVQRCVLAPSARKVHAGAASMRSAVRGRSDQPTFSTLTSADETARNNTGGLSHDACITLAPPRRHFRRGAPAVRARDGAG